MKQVSGDLKKNTKAITFLVVLIVAYIIFLLYQAVYFNYQTSQKIKNLKSDLQAENGNEQRLKDLIAYYNTDTFKELEARKKLGLKMPGEKVVKVDYEAEDGLTPAQNQIATISSPIKSNAQKWLDFLSGRD